MDNTLDIILSTNDALINNITIGNEFRSSDHIIVHFNINLGIYNENHSVEEVYVYRKGDYEKLRTILSMTDWSCIYRETNINEAWAKFTNILNSAVKSCIPVCKRRPNINNKPKCWNNKFKIRLSLKNSAYQKYKRTQLERDKAEFQRLRRDTKKLTKQSRKRSRITQSQHS